MRSRFAYSTYGEWLLRAPLEDMTVDEKRHASAMRRWDDENPKEARLLQSLVGKKVRLIGRHRAYDGRSALPRDGAGGIVLRRFADRLFVDFFSCGQLTVKAEWIRCTK